MKQTLLGTSVLATLFVAGAYWSGMPTAQADPQSLVQDVDIGGPA